MRLLFRCCRDLIQVLGLHSRVSLDPLVLEREDLMVDLSNMSIKKKKNKEGVNLRRLDAETRRSYVEQLRGQIDDRVGGFTGHRHHFYDDLGSGGLVELVYMLSQELRFHRGRYDLLIRALELQNERFDLEDPMLVQLSQVLEKKCRYSQMS
jgi:hypothetical protein